MDHIQFLIQQTIEQISQPLYSFCHIFYMEILDCHSFFYLFPTHPSRYPRSRHPTNTIGRHERLSGSVLSVLPLTSSLPLFNTSLYLYPPRPLPPTNTTS